MLRLRTFLPPFALVLAACGQADFGTPPEQLEAIVVKGDSTYIAEPRKGALTVTGSERDFSLTIADPAGEKTLTVHTPGKSDLSRLTGKTATLSLGDGTDGERSILVADDQGPLYVGYIGYGFDLDKLFGADFARYGEPVAAVTEEHKHYSETHSYSPVVLRTDDGDASLLPGEVASVVIAGKTYRAAAIAADKVDIDVDELGCGPRSVLSFELLRVDAPPPKLKLIRPQALTRATLSCGI